MCHLSFTFLNKLHNLVGLIGETQSFSRVKKTKLKKSMVVSSDDENTVIMEIIHKSWMAFDAILNIKSCHSLILLFILLSNITYCAKSGFLIVL